jgi:hypothetical protein
MPKLKNTPLERIKAEIEKTGLPTEIKVTKLLEEKGWFVYNEHPYLDMENNTIRTLDIRAAKSIKKPNVKNDDPEAIEAFWELYIECKKSDGQKWVFHVDYRSDSISKFFFDRFFYDWQLNNKVFISKKSHPISESQRRHITILRKIPEAYLKIPYSVALSHQVIMKGKDNFFDAFMQILKALNYRDIEDCKLSSERTVGPPEIIVPIVVFDGELFECHYERGNLEVSRTDFVRSLVHGLPSQGIPALIDVVTLDYFPAYLNILEEELLLHKDDLKEAY